VKPPPFRYSAPSTTSDALDLLAAEPTAKILAGGQSLIPLLNMRLAAPSHLVDITRIPELDVIETGPDGVRVGAAVRQVRLEHDDQALKACPLLADAIPLVAHPVIRNRGTVCGSIAHGDPAAELTAALALLGGTVRLASARGHRDLPAGEFFVAPLETALQPGELVESVFFPAVPATTGTAFVELSRRHGDYALCGVALTLDRETRAARAAYLGVAAVPLVLDLPSEDPGGFARERVDPEDDIHATAAYRRHLAGVLTERALRKADA
jgi:CO/xanthine dehydrogenase FAD-binding subunit